MIHRQTPYIEIYVFNFPFLFDLPLVVGRLLSVSEYRDACFTTVCNVNTINILIVIHYRLCPSLPKDIVVILGFHHQQPGILKLNQETRPLAEVAPDCVVDDLIIWSALRLADCWTRLELEDEAVFAAYDFLSYACCVYKQIGRRPWIQSLLKK